MENPLYLPRRTIDDTCQDGQCKFTCINKPKVYLCSVYCFIFSPWVSSRRKSHSFNFQFSISRACPMAGLALPDVVILKGPPKEALILTQP